MRVVINSAPENQDQLDARSAKQLRYAVDSDGALRAEWQVWVGATGPHYSLEVLVGAETGRALGVRSLIEY